MLHPEEYEASAPVRHAFWSRSGAMRQSFRLKKARESSQPDPIAGPFPSAAMRPAEGARQAALPP